jgi:hypothetical protein
MVQRSIRNVLSNCPTVGVKLGWTAPESRWAQRLDVAIIHRAIVSEKLPKSHGGMASTTENANPHFSTCTYSKILRKLGLLLLSSGQSSWSRI